MKKHSDIIIKVLSLGIGLAVGIVLIAKVFFELSYDSFYKDIERVYTINTLYSLQGNEEDYGQVSGAVAVGLMEEVPGVEAGTRTTYVFNGDIYLDEEGNKIEVSRGGWSTGDGEIHYIYAMTQEQADQLRALIDSVDSVMDQNSAIFDIVNEQAAAFFAGQKSAEEVARLIQSRASIYVNEQR